MTEQQHDLDETSPFDLADVPLSAEAEDALPQRKIFDSIFLRQEGVQRTGPTWEQTKTYPAPLSTLANIFKTKNKALAINLLRRRVNLKLDGDLCYRPDDPSLLWNASKHFLDYSLVVAGSIGLHPFLPNRLVDHTFTVTLDLNLQHREFRAKFGKLGFDPTGSMMAIGSGQSSEMWLGFCPLENAADVTIANEAPLLNEKHGDTRLTSIHFRMAVMFLAHALSKIPSLAINVMHPYGIGDDFDEWTVKDATNI